MSAGDGVPRASISDQVRPPAVAGLFYPGGADALRATVDALLARAATAYPATDGLEPAGLEPASLDPPLVAGILVPHAGLVYSGVVAAAGWRVLLPSAALLPSPAPSGPLPSPAPSGPPPTVVLLGTNHGAAWLDGVGAWDGGPWHTPLGDVAVDRGLTDAIIGLGEPFGADARCHMGEHSLEVQLPFIARLAPDARIVALSVGVGTGRRGVEAGERLGRLLAQRRASGERILLAISTDMAHYPRAAACERVTRALLPHILGLAPEALAEAEAATSRAEPGVSCGMCGVQPAVVGLVALRAMGVRPGIALAAATSADAGGDSHRTVGYLSVAFAAG